MRIRNLSPLDGENGLVAASRKAGGVRVGWTGPLGLADANWYTWNG